MKKVRQKSTFSWCESRGDAPFLALKRQQKIDEGSRVRSTCCTAPRCYCTQDHAIAAASALRPRVQDSGLQLTSEAGARRTTLLRAKTRASQSCGASPWIGTRKHAVKSSVGAPQPALNHEISLPTSLAGSQVMGLLWEGGTTPRCFRRQTTAPFYSLCITKSIFVRIPISLGHSGLGQEIKILKDFFNM